MISKESVLHIKPDKPKFLFMSFFVICALRKLSKLDSIGNTS